jgi:hypothetical protein
MQSNKYLYINLFIFVVALVAIAFLSWFYVYPAIEKKNMISGVALAETQDKTPPQITEINIEAVTPTSTIITWKTDKNADSLVNYNVSRDYGIARNPEYTKEHRLVIPELSAAQLYYYRIISSDANGNQSISNDYNFTTKDNITPPQDNAATPAPTSQTDKNGTGQNPENGQGAGQGGQQSEAGNGAGDGGQNYQAGQPGDQGAGQGGQNVADAQQQELINKTLSLLEGINSEEGLALIESKIRELANEKAKPPVISGDFAKVEVGTDYAKVSWKTDKESNSIVAFTTDKEYSPTSPSPYKWKMGEPNQMVEVHEVMITGLKPATTYHYQVQSKSALELESVSADNTFRTKSILPEIYNINASKIEEDAATIDFTTNIPCSAIIEYTDLNTNLTKLEGVPTLVTDHTIRIKDLKFDTYYSAVIKVQNEQKEQTVSDPITFTTTKDIIPPVISKVNTESTLYPGTENKTQTIISWHTDEPAKCQFFYGQGLAADNSPSTLAAEEDFTTNHVQVVTAFQPAMVYKFWLECNDKTLNKGKSESFTMLTPAREQSILDLIIKNFEGTFGWLNKK